MSLKSEKPVYLTADGKVHLEQELEYLRTVKRRQVAERIQQAKALGDVSESGEYEDAKREQAFVEGRIREIEAMLNKAVVIGAGGRSDGVIRLGSTVRVVDSDGVEEIFTIVGSAESSSINGRISNESPVGKALLGRRVGEKVAIVAPNGRFELTILAVECVRVFDQLEEQQQQRFMKVRRLREQGIEPYPPRFRRTHTAAEAVDAFDRLQGETVTVAGRLRSIRIMGKASFAHIADGSGRIQLHFRHDLLGDQRYEFLRRYLDLGDIVGASGPLFRTRTGEITVEVRDFSLLAKAINPPPEKWHGLTDIEKRYRQRYVDLMVNEQSRRVFMIRTELVRAIRAFLDAEGFMEVETPILQPIYGGAVARPFVTYHNALDQQLYLRVADELYLKRLIVGGFEKVYEIGKDFRNEGISTQHNPEFTMLELYQAYADYSDIMDLVERLISTVAQQVLGTLRITYQGRELDLTAPWPRVPLRELVVRYAGLDYSDYPEVEALRDAALRAGADVPPGAHRGKIVDALLKRFVEDHLTGPIFVVDYPVELSPLAKRKPDDPTHVERFEVYMAGMEVCNAFTELNDPLDQYERFRQQLEFRKAGDVEAHEMDEDFINALMYGMPPTGGLGIGIDRLTMVLADQPSIRDVILFPHMRPRKD